jgi:glucose/arabinose dehydrogenase
MLVSVGSGSNVDDPDTHPREFHRADVLEYTPDGKFIEVYAHGIRNCVGEAINPTTGQLWCSTNERDNLGNHLVPDYVTSVKEGGFYGGPGITWAAIRIRACRSRAPTAPARTPGCRRSPGQG